MTVHRSPASFGLDSFLAAHRSKDVLRFITCGSVDDGKSTLIGRLLHDSKQLFDDQIATLEADSRKHGTQAGGIDFALLVDGLSAEREQGITIDVAYRFFSTEKRTFIVADTPGHEQYTRNMATGASTTELAILLVDARKGLTRQTRRHSLLVAMLGIRKVVLAINKMDLVGWSQATYDGIVADYAAFSADLGFDDVACIPLSALNGDNVTAKSLLTPWYEGPTLLTHLEEVQVGRGASAVSLRLPIQWVSRPSPDFRGYAGMIAAGSLSVGEQVSVLPSGRETRVARIVTLDGDLPRAVAGQSVTVTFTDEVDASRGDLIAGIDAPPRSADRLEARLFWTSDEPARPGATFHLKLGPASAIATITSITGRIEPDTMDREAAGAIGPNDIADVVLTLDRPLTFDSYVESRDTGSFILIDRESSDTAAMGLVLTGGDTGAACRETLTAKARRVWSSVSKRLREIGHATARRASGVAGTALAAFLFTGEAHIAVGIALAAFAIDALLQRARESWLRG